MGRTCSVMQLDRVRAYRWQARLAEGTLEERAGGAADLLQRLLDVARVCREKDDFPALQLAFRIDKRNLRARLGDEHIDGGHEGDVTQIELQTGDLPVPHLILQAGTAPEGALSSTQKPAEHSRTQHSLPADGDDDPLLVELERWLEAHL